ncbi:hypothetical protein GIB67_029182 [Kingdonia uniflora]|uniref:Uncharacterized protein n=1 Tax=Kingdonia uniflora TaxID=39325 RepID=A0A7J7LRY7_9MAGN|nr:hypothetical protein GIB67_029182 [Kingdonia uniflora]
MESLGVILGDPNNLYPLLKLKIAANHAAKHIPPEPHWAFCYTMLHKVFMSFGLIIQQLGHELRNAVCIFYLVLRILDTVEPCETTFFLVSEPCVARILGYIDKFMFDVVSLRIRTQRYNFILGVEVVAVIYRICYKVMNTLCPRAILKNELGNKTIVTKLVLKAQLLQSKATARDDLVKIDSRPTKKRHVARVVGRLGSKDLPKISPQNLNC